MGGHFGRGATVAARLRRSQLLGRVVSDYQSWQTRAACRSRRPPAGLESRATGLDRHLPGTITLVVSAWRSAIPTARPSRVGFVCTSPRCDTIAYRDDRIFASLTCRRTIGSSQAWCDEMLHNDRRNAPLSMVLRCRLRARHEAREGIGYEYTGERSSRHIQRWPCRSDDGRLSVVY